MSEREESPLGRNINTPAPGFVAAPLPYMMHPQLMSTPMAMNPQPGPPTSTLSDYDIQRIVMAIKGQVVAEVHAAFQHQFDHMKSTIDTLSEQNKELTKRVDDLEMYSRRSCVRITGVPEEESDDSDGKEPTAKENTTEKIGQLAKLIDVDISEADIKVSHRINRRDGRRDRPRQIIARIEDYDKRHALISRGYKLGKIQGKEGIYICQELTRAMSKIAYQARQLAREEKIKSSYVWDGKILITDLKGGKHSVQSLDEFISVVNSLGIGKDIPPHVTAEGSA